MEAKRVGGSEQGYGSSVDYSRERDGGAKNDYCLSKKVSS
jgi:hypothetical protein